MRRNLRGPYAGAHLGNGTARGPSREKAGINRRRRYSGTGGTSLSSPLFAGVLVLVNEQRFASGRAPIGFANPALYRLRVGEQGSDAPIIDVKAPTEPMSMIVSFCAFEDSCAFGPNIVGINGVNSVPGSNGQIIEGVDSSL
jgi:subtilase family serine protease